MNNLLWIPISKCTQRSVQEVHWSRHNSPAVNSTFMTLHFTVHLILFLHAEVKGDISPLMYTSGKTLLTLEPYLL